MCTTCKKSHWTTSRIKAHSTSFMDTFMKMWSHSACTVSIAQNRLFVRHGNRPCLITLCLTSLNMCVKPPKTQFANTDVTLHRQRIHIKPWRTHGRYSMEWHVHFSVFGLPHDFAMFSHAFEIAWCLARAKVLLEILQTIFVLDFAILSGLFVRCCRSARIGAPQWKESLWKSNPGFSQADVRLQFQRKGCSGN